MTEDEMVGWHHWLNGHEFEQALGLGDGQGALHSMGLQRVGLNWSLGMFNFKEGMCCFILVAIHRWAPVRSASELNKVTFSLTVRQSGRIPWGSPLYMIVITKAPKEGGGGEVKETDPPWSQKWPFPATISEVFWTSDFCMPTILPYSSSEECLLWFFWPRLTMVFWVCMR